MSQVPMIAPLGCSLMYLSLYFFFGHVMSSHYSEQMSQRSQVSRMALSRGSQNVFVFVIVFVFVFVFVFVCVCNCSYLFIPVFVFLFVFVLSLHFCFSIFVCLRLCDCRCICICICLLPIKAHTTRVGLCLSSMRLLCGIVIPPPILTWGLEVLT